MKGAWIRTDISTLKVELMSNDLPEDLCYGGELTRPVTHYTTFSTHLANDEDSESANNYSNDRL